jgi:Flp pilus assembly protein TadG
VSGDLVERLRGRNPEAGTGLIGTAAGVTVFLVLLLFAVQLSVNLYATSTVNAAGYDSARLMASADVDHWRPSSLDAARRRSEARFHQLVGAAGDGAELTWELTGGAVRLRVQMEPPGILPSSMGSVVGFDHIDRTFVVRIEELR